MLARIGFEPRWEQIMLKTFAAALLATALAAGVASAHGSGGSPGAMPGISYTDMPTYAPKPIKPVKPVATHAPKQLKYSTSP
jgi:hypothetical protein